MELSQIKQQLSQLKEQSLWEEVIVQIKNLIKKAEAKEIDISAEEKLELLLELGSILEQLGKLKKAEVIYQKIEELAEQQGVNKFIVESLIAKGRIADIRGEKEKVLNYFKKAIELAKSIGGDFMEANASSLLGYVYAREGNPGEARKLLEDSFDLIKEKIDDEKINEIAAKITNQLGLIEFRKGNFHDARNFFNTTIKLTYGREMSLERGEAYRYLGVIYSIQKDIEKSFLSYKEALTIFKKNSFKYGLARLYTSIAQLLTDINRYKQATFFLKKAAQFYSYLDSQKNIGMIYGKLGDVYLKRAAYSLAKTYYEKDKEISEELGNERGLSYTYRNLAKVHFLLKNNEKAIEYYTIAVDLFRKYEDLRNLAETLLDFSWLYYEIGDFNKAREFGIEAMKIFTETHREEEIGKVHYLFGLIFTKQNNVELALEAFRDALEELEDTNYRDVFYLVRLAMAKVYYFQGEVEKALSLIRRLLEELKGEGLIKVEEEIYEFLEKNEEEFLLETLAELYRE